MTPCESFGRLALTFPQKLLLGHEGPVNILLCGRHEGKDAWTSQVGRQTFLVPAWEAAAWEAAHSRARVVVRWVQVAEWERRR